MFSGDLEASSPWRPIGSQCEHGVLHKSSEGDLEAFRIDYWCEASPLQNGGSLDTVSNVAHPVAL